MAERVLRLIYFEGEAVPMVEIWTHTGEVCDGSGTKRYAYVRTGFIPACGTQQEWLEMLNRAEVTHFMDLDPSSVAAVSWDADFPISIGESEQ